MPFAEACPEFAHASGHEICVFVEVGRRGDGDRRVGRAFAETQHVEFLSAPDARQRAAQIPAVVGRLGVEPGERAVELFDQGALALVGLAAGQVALQRAQEFGVRAVLDHFQRGAQVFEPGDRRDGRRISEMVSIARASR